MEGPMSHFETQAMVAKAQNEERAARVRHIEDVARDLRAEFRREVIELREEVGELVASVHEAIRREEASRHMDIGIIQRILDARAEAGI
jgi:F0F1-type ATP synthase membrane subunit b/b'